MKNLKLSMYVVLPILFALIIHLVFWYGNSFKPFLEWDVASRNFAAFLFVIAIIVGIALANLINDGKDES